MTTALATIQNIQPVPVKPSLKVYTLAPFERCLVKFQNELQVLGHNVELHAIGRLKKGLYNGANKQKR